MAWINVPGVTGKVYVPEDPGETHKKHSCKTCYACQWCDETRCRVCRCDQAKIDASSLRQCCVLNSHKHTQAAGPDRKRQYPNPEKNSRYR